MILAKILNNCYKIFIEETERNSQAKHEEKTETTNRIKIIQNLLYTQIKLHLFTLIYFQSIANFQLFTIPNSNYSNYSNYLIYQIYSNYSIYLIYQNYSIYLYTISQNTRKEEERKRNRQFIIQTKQINL